KPARHASARPRCSGRDHGREQERSVSPASPLSAHFPKFALHPGAHFHEIREVMGTSKFIALSTAFPLQVPEPNSPPVVRQLQIDGTSVSSWQANQNPALPRVSPS